MNVRAMGAVVAAMLFAGRVTAEAGGAATVPGRYGSEAREVMEYIQKTFWDSKTSLYVKSADDRTPDYIWREAAMFSALVGASRHEPRSYGPVLARFFHALDGYWDAKAPIPAYEPAPTRGNGNDKYYDDNAWLIITFGEAYQLTGERAYLSRAQETARFVAGGWDEQGGGGIWWHQSHKDGSKNTCANGPAAVGYLCLARLGPAKDAKAWVLAATKVVDWTRDHLEAKDGLFEDRMIVATGEIKKGKLTYNSALMLRACLGLYRQTGRVEYLEQARRIGNAAKWFAARETGVYRDPLKWSQFMVEADLELYRATGEDYLIERARTNADAYYAAWKKERPADMMSNAGLARILWLLADGETDAGKAFWKAADGDAPQKPAAGWNWRIGDKGEDVWLYAGLDGTLAYSFKIGAGGAIAAMNEEWGGTRPLLSPSFQGEHTDRIIQWTAWSNDITHEVSGLPKLEWRFNVTQGGCFDGTLSPVMEVAIDRHLQRIDVYSVPQEQWKTQQREAMQCKLSSLTRYELLPEGVLKIRRVMRIGPVKLNGTITKFGHLYIEAWTPFLRSPETFDAVSTEVDEEGQVSKGFKTGKEFSNYPHIDVTTTSGYAVAYCQDHAEQKTAVGLVFGKRQIEAAQSGNIHQLNLMQWDDGIGILPAVTVRDVEPGSIIEQTLYVVARKGLGRNMRDVLMSLATKIPPPRILRPAELEASDLREIAAHLTTVADRVGVRTEHLRALGLTPHER